MRPSSLGGGRILRRTLSVRLSLSLSVCPTVPLLFILFFSRTVLRANIQNRKTSVFAYGPASLMYFSARTEGRISYGHLGRTNSCSSLRGRKPMPIGTHVIVIVIVVNYVIRYVCYLFKLNIHWKPAFVDKMETSSKGEDSSSNKDANKDKKSEGSKEPELVSTLVVDLFGLIRLLIGQWQEI